MAFALLLALATVPPCAATAPAFAAAPWVVGFLGREGGNYQELLEELQQQGKQKNLEIILPEGHFQNFQDILGFFV